MPVDCIFCRIVAGEVPSEKIFEDGSVIVFADINPATRGHCLVVPRKHSVNILDIPGEDVLAVIAAAREIARVMPSALGCKGVNLFHCAGAEAWQDVFHFHMHVIPRYSRQELKQAWSMKPGIPAEVKEAAGKVRAAMGRK